MAKAVGLTTALLPVAGVLVRGTSFRSAGFAGGRWQLARSASLSQLVTTGLFAILPQIIGIGAIALAWGSLVRVAHARHLGSATYTTGVRLAADIQMLRTQIDAVAPGDTEALAAVSEKLNALQPEVDAFNLDYEQVRGLIESFDDDPVVRRFNRLPSPRLLGAVAVAIALLTVLFGSPFLPVLLAEMVAPVLLVALYRVSRKDPLVTFRESGRWWW